MTPFQSIQARLGEHCRNFVIIIQPDDAKHTFELVYSDPFATMGLLNEACKRHAGVMNLYQNPEDAFEWSELEEDDDDEEDVF